MLLVGRREVTVDGWVSGQSASDLPQVQCCRIRSHETSHPNLVAVSDQHCSGSPGPLANEHLSKMVEFESWEKDFCRKVPLWLKIYPRNAYYFSSAVRAGVGVCQVPYGVVRANVEAATASVPAHMCPSAYGRWSHWSDKLVFSSSVLRPRRHTGEYESGECLCLLRSEQPGDSPECR